MNEFNKLEVVKLIYKIVGNIKPCGICENDNRAIKNLTLLTEVIRELIDDISQIEYDFDDRREYSIQKIVEKCTSFLNELSKIELK